MGTALLAFDGLPWIEFARLMLYARGHHNDAALAAMLASRDAGVGALPFGLGLSPEGYRDMAARHFPHASVTPALDGEAVPAERRAEFDELLGLLLTHRGSDDPSVAWMAEIVAVGCLASDHLWQDLGLFARDELSALMRRNFPRLAARNDRNMKWKRFLYKQLCEAEGIYVCRSPSCEVCTDYAACFGPAD